MIAAPLYPIPNIHERSKGLSISIWMRFLTLLLFVFQSALSTSLHNARQHLASFSLFLLQCSPTNDYIVSFSYPFLSANSPPPPATPLSLNAFLPQSRPQP